MSYQLTKQEVDQFIYEGYIRIDDAFPKELANEVVSILWKDIPFDPNDAYSWTEPVVRLGMYSQQPFTESVNTPRLHAAFDQLVGPNKWIPCSSVGSFPIRFPSSKQPNDTGRHVDVSFPGTDTGNYFEWRANIYSKGRALLMLILYSDVSEHDAPTVIYKGSHWDVARLLKPEGSHGLSFLELANKLTGLPEREATFATGNAGTVYLCHPFLVHAAQAHKGTEPKFMAQPPLVLRSELDIECSKVAFTPVEQAIRLALQYTFRNKTNGRINDGRLFC